MKKKFAIISDGVPFSDSYWVCCLCTSNSTTLQFNSTNAMLDDCLVFISSGYGIKLNSNGIRRSLQKAFKNAQKKNISNIKLFRLIEGVRND